jgi:hypothetical protein
MSHSPRMFLRLLLLFVLLALPVLACDTVLSPDGGDEATAVIEVIPDTAEEAAATVDVLPTEASAPTELPAATEAAEPTDEPEPTAVPEVEVDGPVGDVGMSRANPYSLGELVQAPNWDIQILEVVRGDEAWQMVLEANEYNEPPVVGMEYVLVKIFARNTYEDGTEHEITYSDFNLTGDHYKRYSTAYVVDPEPALEAVLFPGGETEGWITFPVDIGEGNLVLIFDEWANFDDDRFRYLAVEEGASLAIPAEVLDVEPNDIGLTRDNPAQIGETTISDNWEITLLEVVRGEAAEAMVMEAYEFNDPPEEGFEYVLARVQMRNISSEEASEWLDNSNFTTVGELNEVYDSPYYIVPDPDFDFYAYPGAEGEGWVALQAAKDEGGLLMIFESFLDFDGNSRRYFAME